MATITKEELVKMTAADIAAQQAAIEANKPEKKPIEQPTTSAADPPMSADEGTIITRNATNSANAQRGQSEMTGLSINSQIGNSTTTSQVGALTPLQQLEQERRIAALNQGNNIRFNPTTGQYEYIDQSKTTLGSVLPGLRKNAEEAERINYNRSLGSALYNSLNALADMGIAIGGGNVHQRELDKTGIEAAKDTQARKDKLAEQEAAAKQRDEDLLRAAADNAEKLRERFDAMRERVSSTTSGSTGVSTNNQVTNSQQATSSASRSANGQQIKGDGVYNRYNSYGGGGRGKGPKEVTIRFNVPEKNGVPAHVESRGFKMSDETYERLGGYLSSVYNELVNEYGKTEVENVLQKAGIQKKDPATDTYNGFDLLSSGIIFDDPQIRSEFEKIIRNSDMSDNDKENLIKSMKTYSLSQDEPEEPEEEETPWWQFGKKKKSGNGNKFGTVPQQGGGEIDKDFRFITQPQITEP